MIQQINSSLLVIVIIKEYTIICKSNARQAIECAIMILILLILHSHVRENHSFNNTCILKCVKMNTFPIYRYINLKIYNNVFSIKNTQGFIKLDSLKYISPGSFPYQLFGINNISNSMSNIAIHFLAQSTSLTKSECNQEEKKRLRFSKFQFRWKSINS